MNPTRRDFVRGGLALAALPGKMHLALDSEGGTSDTLWYAAAAKRWLEALPIGNGRIGGMVFGGINKERISLTESTAWSGALSTSDVNPGGLKHLSQIRQLLFEENYGEAQQLCKEHLLSHPTSFGTNLPLFDLTLDFDYSNDATQYRRTLSLDEGIACVDFRVGGHRYKRESFCSNPDGVLIVHLTSEAASQLSLKVSLQEVRQPGRVRSVGPDTLAFRGNAFEAMHSTGTQGVQVECRVRTLHQNGKLSVEADSLEIRDADSVTLLIAIGTSYGGSVPGRSCDETLRAAATKSYVELRQNHITDYQPLFRRVQLILGSKDEFDKTPTDKRRRAMDAGTSDPALCALFFQYGRYLTIAGSRHNSPLPLALQGIWNDGLASSMGWTDDFHLDINTEQNYWVAEVGNLSEVQTPLFGLIDGLRRAGRHTAQELYGAPGWVSHVVTNPWGYTAPGSGLGWGIFVTSGIWIALQMWEHFQFTGDKEFLRDRAYPVFREAAEFFLAYMVVHPKLGWLVTGPSDSPENAFITPSGGHCSESMGPTCDRVLVYALFTHCLKAQELLSIDQSFGLKIEQARQKLAPLQIGRYGQVQEWLEDFEEAIPNHRHTSHLIALYPESQISLNKTPALAKAARVTLERRIDHADWEDTEWTRANFVNYYARLCDGDAAHKHLTELISKATEDNLLTYSRGGVAGAVQNIFAIDGNTAGAAGVAEMLVQSHEDSIHLLPALPSAWPDGHVSGLCARGGFQVEIRWASLRLSSATIMSRQGGNCVVRYGKSAVPIRIEPGKTIRLTESAFRERRG